jgi:hypothetical protein
MNELWQTMWHTWTEGGWVMIAMVVLSLVMYVSAAQCVDVRRHARHHQGE